MKMVLYACHSRVIQDMAWPLPSFRHAGPKTRSLVMPPGREQKDQATPPRSTVICPFPHPCR